MCPEGGYKGLPGPRGDERGLLLCPGGSHVVKNGSASGMVSVCVLWGESPGIFTASVNRFTLEYFVVVLALW